MRLVDAASFEVVEPGRATPTRPASTSWSATHPGRRDHRHPHAADAHHRGPRRGDADPRRSTRMSVCWCSHSSSRRRSRDGPARRSNGRNGRVPAQGPRHRPLRGFADAVRRIGAGGSDDRPHRSSASFSAAAAEEDPLDELTGREREILAPNGRGPVEPRAYASKASFDTQRTVETHVHTASSSSSGCGPRGTRAIGACWQCSRFSLACGRWRSQRARPNRLRSAGCSRP